MTTQVTTSSSAQPTTMQDLLSRVKDKIVPFRAGDTTEVTVLHKTRQRLLVDIAGVTLGIIPAREFSFDIDEVKIGDKSLAYVLAAENPEGYTVLSLKRADRQRLWQTLEGKLSNHETVKVKVTSANRGGLMVEYAGVEGFMPVSQLASEHYPKVEGGDSQEILNRLKTFIGQILEAKIITVDRLNNKLIFSEKAIDDDRIVKLLQEIKIGQKLRGQVVGIVDFGLFVKIPYQGEMIEGLVHLSEITWDRVDNLKSLYSIGNKIEVLVIGLEKTKLSLSIKRLHADPWEKIKTKYQVGSLVKGEVTRITPYGAFVHMPEGVEALIHLSELPIKNKNDISDSLSVGKNYDFRVISFDTKKRKINLSLKTEKSQKAAKTPKKKPTAKTKGRRPVAKR